MKNNIREQPFGNPGSGAVTAYTLSNAIGMDVTIINYGATITRIMVPDKQGITGNVVLGFDSLDKYIENGNHYFGGIIGRYCNRVGGAKFSLEGKEYTLYRNDKGSSLHGGQMGFDKVLWNVEEQEEAGSLKLHYLSKDGEEGYPGNLAIELIYRLTDCNELLIDYTASADKSTPINLTSHSYFNLSAGHAETILDHELAIFADEFTATDEDHVPTGELLNLENTPMDFHIAKRIGRDIGQLQGGYDHNYILKNISGKKAELYDPQSGRFMEMFTSEPALQFYSGNFLHEVNAVSKKEPLYARHAALCLEAQHYPNSLNEPSFPCTILQPGEKYRQTTAYKFSTK